MNWERLFDEHGSALLLYARQWVPGLADAEDTVQEAFIRVYRSGYRDPAQALPLLYQAIRWNAIDQARRRQRTASGQERLRAESENADAWFDAGLECKERREQIEESLGALPAEQREVLVMKIWGGLTFKQITEVVGAPQGTVASRYRYGLAAMRRCLEPELIHET